jgi:hypothetical protein
MKLHGYFWNSPQIIAAGNAAAGTYVRLACAARVAGDGHVVPAPLVRAFFRNRRILDDLVRHDLIVLRFDGSVRVLPLIDHSATYRRTAAGYATRSQIAARAAFYGGLCWICRAAPMEAMDHVKPLRAGGTNWPANLRPACKSCNSRKGATWPYQPETT